MSLPESTFSAWKVLLFSLLPSSEHSWSMAFRTLSSTEALMVPGMSAGRPAVDCVELAPELPAEIRFFFRFSALSLLVLFSFALAEAQTRHR